MPALDSALIQKLQALSPEDLAKVLRFVETLTPSAPPPQRPSLRGLFVHWGIDLTPEDFAAARREAWAHFPRDITLD
jgi:hypothetical protein